MTARDRLLLALGLSIAAVIAAWVMVIQPKRDQAARLGSQIAAAEQQLQSASGQAATAQANEHAYASNYATVARLGEAVPSDDEVPSLIYQLQAAATGTGVSFQSLVLNAGGSGSSTSTGSSALSQTQLPPGATVGPAGFPTMPFTFTFEGNFFHLSSFFARLQRFVEATQKRIDVHGRLMTLNAIDLGPGPSGFPRITATIYATTYLVPSSQGLTNGASAAAPAASAGATVPAKASGSSPTSTPTATVTP
jgi:hypothetical protein